MIYNSIISDDSIQPINMLGSLNNVYIEMNNIKIASCLEDKYTLVLNGSDTTGGISDVVIKSDLNIKLSAGKTYVFSMLSSDNTTIDRSTLPAHFYLVDDQSNPVYGIDSNNDKLIDIIVPTKDTTISSLMFENTTAITYTNLGFKLFLGSLSSVTGENLIPYPYNDVEPSASGIDSYTINSDNGSFSLTTDSSSTDSWGIRFNAMNVLKSNKLYCLGTYISDDSITFDIRDEGSPFIQTNSYNVFLNNIDPSTTIYFNYSGSTNVETATVKPYLANLSLSFAPETVTPITEIKHYYGVRYNQNTKTWTRYSDAADFSDPVAATASTTGSSPFDNIMPWSGMVRSTDANAGTVVAIPKFYYKLSVSDTSFDLAISTSKIDDTYYCSPAHMDRGDGNGERDTVYVGRYHSNEDDYKSTTGKTPVELKSSGVARTKCHSLGNNVWAMDYSMLITIQMLYLVEFANWDSQETIGYGSGAFGNVENTGSTDSMAYHTGTVLNSRTNFSVGIQYRYIEDLWANVYDYINSVYILNVDNVPNIYVSLKPQGDSAFDTTICTNIGSSSITSASLPATLTQSTINNFNWLFYPKTSGTTSNYIIPDVCEFDETKELCFGGSYESTTTDIGLFCMTGVDATSGTEGKFGCRIMVL